MQAGDEEEEREYDRQEEDLGEEGDDDVSGEWPVRGSCAAAVQGQGAGAPSAPHLRACVAWGAARAPSAWRQLRGSVPPLGGGQGALERGSVCLHLLCPDPIDSVPRLPAGGAAPAAGAAPQPMALDRRRPPPRRQHAVLLQDESESATMSFGGSGQHRQGAVSLHPHRRQLPPAAGGPRAALGSGAAAAPRPRVGLEATPPADAGMSTTGPSSGGAGLQAQQQGEPPPQKHLSGLKHRRDGATLAAAAAAATKSALGGRNGSDSGSNSPGEQTPARGSQEEDAQGAQLGPPAKQARGARKA